MIKMDQKQENDLIVPLSFNNQFASFIFRNKSINKVAYKPVIACFATAAITFIALAIYMFVAMSKVTSVQVNYYEVGGSKCLSNTVCNINFDLPSNIKAPIYVLYQLDEFYQNHRRYIQSKSNQQLLGQTISASQASICSPYITNSEMKVTKSWAGITLDPNAIASPCGAIAYTFYNDSFSLSSNGVAIEINQNNITWPGDIYGKYRRAQNSNLTQWIDPENEHFINWMRTGGLPSFKKLWGKIDTSLGAGTYTMTITNNFNLSEWSGNKYFILTNKSSAGGKNYLLPIILTIVSLFSAITVFYITKISTTYRKALMDI